MYPHSRLRWLLALFTFASISAQAQPTPSQYPHDLGTVYGSIKAVAAIADICSESFPSSRLTNDAAYQRWRNQYLPFLHKIERHYAAVITSSAGNDPQSNLALLRQAEQKFDSVKTNTRSQIKSKGDDYLERLCGNYPNSLVSEKFDLERKYFKEMNSINAVELDTVDAEINLRSASCSLINEQATAFCRERLPSVISAARENRPPVPGSIALWTQVAMLRDQTANCRHIEGVIQNTNLPLASHFKKHFELFSKLERFMSQWELEPPNKISDGEMVLNRLQELHVDLTSAHP